MANSVDIWVGKFKSKKDFSGYLAETYGEDDNRPISQFAADLGETFYDHDFIESTFVKVPYDHAELFAGLSYSKSYFEAAKAKIEEFGIDDANVVILSFENGIASPRSATGDRYQLQYLGSFLFDSASGPVGVSEESDLRHLKVMGGKTVLYEGHDVSIVPLTNDGLVIGRGSAEFGIPRLDLSTEVPDVAEIQILISALNDGLWSIEDLGRNGLSRLGKDSFDGEKSMPWPGIRLSIGDIEFEWGMGQGSL